VCLIPSIGINAYGFINGFLPIWLIYNNSKLTHPTVKKRVQYNYDKNTKECNVTYHRTRTGPNWFRVFYKNRACIRFTPKGVGRVFGIAKFTPGVNDIRDWCYQMVDKYGSDTDKDNDEYKKYIEKHGFGPEVHEEPNDNTKMVI
jgi:hypothetical protein